MSTDVAETEVAKKADALEGDTSLVEDEISSEEIEAKKDADLLAEVEKIQQTGETKIQETKTGEGDVAEPLAEEKSKEASADEGDGKPPELDRPTLARALEAGFDEDSAERFHQAGLLGDALVTFDRRLIREFGAAEDEARDQRQPPTKQPERPRQTEVDRSGEGATDDSPSPLSTEEYGVDIVKRDAWHQRRIDELATEVKNLRQVSDAFISERAQNFENSFEKQIQDLANSELFGEGNLASLSRDSSERRNRFKVADAYHGLCRARGVDPQELVPELVDRAYHAMFHSEITTAAQRKTLDRLRNAKGQFVTPTRPSGSGPPQKDKKTDEERDADVVEEVQGILDRPVK